MAVSTRSSTAHKRKAPQKIKRPTQAKRPQRSKHGRRAERPFRFMDLPPELRNNVYVLYAEDRTAFLSKSTLTDNSPLLQVNSQIRHEYFPFIVFAKVIKTEVDNFDFRHIVTFINRLSAAELHGLPASTQPGVPHLGLTQLGLTQLGLTQRTLTQLGLTQPKGRHVDIALRFTRIAEYPNYRKWTDDVLLRRWLNRANSPSKKGTMLECRYSLVSPKPGLHRHWRRAVSAFRGAAWEGRAKQEARKILLALSS